MNSNLTKSKPIYFSDYYKVDKSKFKELGVFDPILNFDTKLFVDPILLKSSTSPIIQNAREPVKPPLNWTKKRRELERILRN